MRARFFRTNHKGQFNALLTFSTFGEKWNMAPGRNALICPWSFLLDHVPVFVAPTTLALVEE
jgi:hypothetical protein